MRYRLVSVANFEQIRTALTSPDVTVTAASMTPDKHATFAATMRDVRTLSTAPAFANAHVGLADEADGLRTLTVTLSGQRGTLPAPYVDYLGRDLRVTLTLPGEIVRSNATSVTGATATWAGPIVEFAQQATTTFSVTFRPPAAS